MEKKKLLKKVVVVLMAVLMLNNSMFGGMLDIYAMTQSEYESKVNSFINDPLWRHGTAWGYYKEPDISPHDCIGCCAYVNDFVKYVYNRNSHRDGSQQYYGIDNIKTGDVIYIYSDGELEHWVAILNRSGNVLYTAEGNTWLNGSYKVYISNTRYSIDNGRLKDSYDKGATPTFICGYHFDGVVSSDTTPPTLSNVYISDVTDTGYTVYCTATDNVGVAKVAFPTWTEANNQDDLAAEWWNSQAVYNPVSGNTYSFKVNISDHNNEIGKYITHVYAYDAAGNHVWVV